MEDGPLMERVVSQGEILRVYRLLDVSSIKGFLDQKIVTNTASPRSRYSSTLLHTPPVTNSKSPVVTGSPRLKSGRNSGLG